MEPTEPCCDRGAARRAKRTPRPGARGAVCTWACVLALLPAVALAAAPTRAAAQGRDSVVVVNPVPQPSQTSIALPQVDQPTSPGGAFVRALLLPGWGHAAIGAYTRGGFYFAAETTTGMLLGRTIHRLGVAKDGRDLKEDALRDQLVAAGVPADSIPLRIDHDPEVARSRRLVRSRHQQVEDWAALTIFTVFISGADAFVSAHLRNFPKPIPMTLDVTPAGSLTRVALGLRVALGAPPPDR